MVQIHPTSLSDSPRGKAVISAPHGSVVVAGGLLQLQCTPPRDQGYPAPGWYKWTIPEYYIGSRNTTSSRWEMQTSSVTQSANYSCVVGNTVGGSEPSRSIQVIVEGISLHAIHVLFIIIINVFFGQKVHIYIYIYIHKYK